MKILKFYSTGVAFSRPVEDTSADIWWQYSNGGLSAAKCSK